MMMVNVPLHSHSFPFPFIASLKDSCYKKLKNDPERVRPTHLN
jgi:hypothetical protein